MRALRLIASAAAVFAAAWILAPTSLMGDADHGTPGMLGVDQRDFRLFNNFQDASANNNVTPHPQFPGYVGADMAVWKASRGRSVSKSE